MKNIKVQNNIEIVTCICYNLIVSSAEMHNNDGFGGATCGKRKDLWHD